MADINRSVEAIQNELREIKVEYIAIGRKLSALTDELETLKRSGLPETGQPAVPKTIQDISVKNEPATSPGMGEKNIVTPETVTQRPAPPLVPNVEISANNSFNFEQFIGENLFSKLGILVLVLGVAIGIKYSIDHNLITPTARILCGFLTGIALAGIALRLKAKYFNYSAVLISGAMTLLYFDTYAAHAYYALIPRLLAFSVMGVLTIATVAISLYYDREIISCIGLVYAYAIPFLLSDNSHQFAVLFTFILIVNAGILVISQRKFWQIVTALAMSVTWIIYLSWLVYPEINTGDLYLGMMFLVLFALMFCAVSYFRLESNQSSLHVEILWYSLNTFLLYVFGAVLLAITNHGKDSQALWATAQVILHGLAVYYVESKHEDSKEQQRQIYSYIFIFITIAIPIEFSGNTLTIMWLLWMFALLGIAKMKHLFLAEGFSFVILALVLINRAYNWDMFASKSSDYLSAIPLINVNFGMNCLILASLVILNWVRSSKDVTLLNLTEQYYDRVFTLVVIVLCIALSYAMLYSEILMPFNQWFSRLHLISPRTGFPLMIEQTDIFHYRTLALLGYSIVYLYVAGLTLMRTDNTNTLRAYTGFAALFIFFGFILGLPSLDKLQQSFLSLSYKQYIPYGSVNILVRYGLISLAGGLIYIVSRLIKTMASDIRYRVWFDLTLIVILFAWLSNELLYLFNFTVIESPDRFLTILWGVYAILLIVYGIQRQISYIRLSGFAIFAVTLAKLFCYDILYMSTVLKTVILVITGILLLMSSFLYNKYKQFLFPPDK